MARRVSWTNNSSGHSGTYVYRAPTLDPQNLPAPVATVDPAAQGETAEWVDSEELIPGDYDYAVQDFDGSGSGQLSALATHNVPADLSNSQTGDYIDGGVYAGVMTYGDGRQFHIVMAKDSGETNKLKWGNYGVVTNANDLDDGLYNQDRILTSYDDGSADAFYYCRDYISDGFSDWYLPSRKEIEFYKLALAGHAEITDTNSDRISSSEFDSLNAWSFRFGNNSISTTFKSGAYAGTKIRPIRRVPV